MQRGDNGRREQAHRGRDRGGGDVGGDCMPVLSGKVRT